MIRAMFLRRDKISIFGRVRDFFWPRAGWHRSSRYLFHRLARISGTPYALAGGFACGAAVSFTPFVGLHFILAAIMALMIRANVLSSAIGTAIGNPWTFPFIWVWVYELGLMMGASIDGHGTEDLDFAAIFSNMMEAALRFDLAYLIESIWPVWWPMFLGSLPTFAVVWLAFFLPLRSMIETYQVGRARRHAKKRTEELAMERLYEGTDTGEDGQMREAEK